MSLATRCTTCGTAFRVVQDQLKVSEGWVRCGRCNAVFNALEDLFDLGLETPPEGSQPEPQGASAESGPGPTAVALPPLSSPPPFPGSGAIGLGHTGEPSSAARQAEVGSTPAMRLDEPDRPEFPNARFDPDAGDADAVDSDVPQVEGAEPGLATEPDRATERAPADSTLPRHDDPAADAAEPFAGSSEPGSRAFHTEPDFLLRGQRRSGRRSALERVLLALGAGLLLVALAFQSAHHFRDLLAARWPAARPALAAWCGVWHCVIQPPRRIDDITVESSTLTRAPVPDAFRLAVGLRNHGNLALALPAIELSLTDQTGQLMARRVLSPVDFKAPSNSLPPASDTALQLVFRAANLQVTGYTVEIFYP